MSASSASTVSARVGSLLMRGPVDGIKRLSLDLGGYGPLIAFEDAGLDAAVALKGYERPLN